MKIFICFFALLIVAVFYSCSDEEGANVIPQDAGEYSIHIKYDSVRTYPEGGAVFIISIVPDKDFEGRVLLSAISNSALICKIKNSNLTESNSVSEIEVNPSGLIEDGIYKIILGFEHGKRYKYDTLHIDISQWGCNREDALTKLNEFMDYLDTKHPDLTNIITQDSRCFSTYTNILIVEHYTFLSDQYEVRLCYHVMIPPSDWSKLLIRKRLSWEPLIALHRDTNGNVIEVPITEYPTMFGY